MRQCADTLKKRWPELGGNAPFIVLCVIGVVATAAWLKDFWGYDARTDEYAVAERARRATAGETPYDAP